VQTKRRLADLPGGGGTPLAAGLQEAAQAARSAHQKGLTPTIVLLTDGRANIALDGTPDRAQAALDATRMATLARETGADAIVIDTGNRPERALQTLSGVLGGHYLSLPRADAQKLSDSVQRRLDG
jgi:magnesium chelatase subunit D